MTLWLGILLVIVAGICNALFAAPMKRMPKWEWENQWGMWAVWALLVSAWSLALLSVPDLGGVYRSVPLAVCVATFLLGAGGGIGMVTCGLGLHLMGFSLGFSIILGLTAVTGSLVPMLIHSPGTLLSPGGKFILLGLAATVAGVGCCGFAGMIRERRMAATTGGPAGRSRFLAGLLVCITSAVFNSMINLSFTAGAPIAEAVRSRYPGPLAGFQATNAVWALGMTGAFLPNAIYCGWLLWHRGSARKFTATGTGSYWFWTLVMGAVWLCGYALYGVSTTMLGSFGTTAGWIVFFAMTVLTGNVMGVATGEWKGTSGAAQRWMTLGILLLLSAIFVVGIGSAKAQ